MCILIPEMSFDAFVIFILGLFMIKGIILLILDYFNSSIFINIFLSGIVSLMISIVLAIHPNTLKVLLPIAVGIWFLVSDLFNLKFALYLKDESISNMIIIILMSLISIVCGFILIFNPMESVNALTVSLGIITIA